ETNRARYPAAADRLREGPRLSPTAARFGRGVTLPWLERLEGAGASRGEKVEHHDNDRHRGDGGGQWQVRNAQGVVDRIADQLGIGDELRRDVVTQGEA